MSYNDYADYAIVPPNGKPKAKPKKRRPTRRRVIAPPASDEVSVPNEAVKVLALLRHLSPRQRHRLVDAVCGGVQAEWQRFLTSRAH